MNSKDRMLAALYRETPDRLPATVHMWHDYHLRHFMDGMSAEEAFAACGLDAAITFFPFIEEPASPDWKTECVPSQNEKGEQVQKCRIDTPEGTLHYEMASNEITTWINRHPIQHDEDIYLIEKYQPIPRLLRNELARAYDALGDVGIMRGLLPAFNFQSGIWQEAVEWVGTEKLIMAVYEKPDWVHAFLRILLEKRLAFIEREMKGAKFDLIETGGGAASDTVISPDVFRDFALPYDRQMHAALHEAGHRVVYHTCGGMTNLLNLIPENGCDASETLTPPGMGGNLTDPLRVKASLGAKVCLIGGMDQNNVLKQGDAMVIEAEVRRLFETYGRHGGYIMATCDQFFDVPRESLRAYADAARQCVYA